MSFNYTGYICRKKPIDRVFLWSGDFSNLVMNGAFKIKSNKGAACGFCEEGCPPKVVRITIEEIP